MNALLRAAAGLQFFLEGRDWPFCVIGGLAVLRWGEPRLTRDVDVTVLCPFGSEDELAEAFLQAGYIGRISSAREFVRQSRVLLVQDAGGVPIDVALGALPFEESAVRRSTLFRFADDCELRTCSAEDLLVFKLFAARPRDLVDAESIVLRQRGALDWEYIAAYLQPLAEMKDQPEIMAAFGRLRTLFR